MKLLYALDREDGLDLDSGLAAEWLETNGLGDFASSTALNCPTRRQHGLLVARPDGHEKRHVFFSRFDELVSDGEVELPLSTTGYPGSWAPAGADHMTRFELRPHPTTVHRSGDLEVTREIQMIRGEQAVLLRYKLTSGEGPYTLDLRPFLPFREADALTVANDVASADATRTEHGLAFQPYAGLPEIHFTANAELELVEDPHWYESVDLPRDRERGYPASEDHFSPGVLRATLEPGGFVVVAASLSTPIENPAAAWNRESRRRSKALPKSLDSGASPLARLAATADDFIVESDGRLGIDAGYPWFGEWGRDTFIALPGLTLSRGRTADCERVLTESLEYLQDGLLPNVFGTSKETSHYGSVDASLWFARAVFLYGKAGGSAKRIRREYLPALLEIATAYWEGTGLEIRADEGGLIQAGSDALNATWMDANTPSGPVTPRHGCAVEINALWYSLLKHVETLLDAKSERPTRKLWKERRLLAKRTFLERFWLEDEGYLADVWKDGEADRSVRPNMVIAAALELSPLVKDQRRAVVERAAAELLTPRGLRTLAPGHPDYRPRYEGGPEERDGAYHQGTVWPWLFGFHVEAALRGLGTRKAIREELRATWSEITQELDRSGMNHVSEVFDGEAPHRPGGTIAQAWNTAELLRADAMLQKGRA